MPTGAVLDKRNALPLDCVSNHAVGLPALKGDGREGAHDLGVIVPIDLSHCPAKCAPAIFDRLNTHYFDGKVDARITWGRKSSTKKRRSIRLASYCVEERLIRVHRGLDQRWVPSVYLDWVVFHEMLHCLIPIPTKNGRREFHGEQFARAEQDFEHYEQAQLWERRNVAALLSI